MCRLHRVREVKALPELAAEIAQPAELLVEFDALGDDVQGERAAERDDGAGQVGGLARGLRPQERAIHLDDVDRKAAEIAQRGVAGSEVVHRHAQAERAQFLELDDRDLGVLDQHRLGDLEHQQARIQARLLQGIAYVGDHIAVLELPDGQVDADVERRIAGPQALYGHRLHACLAQHPAADRDDQPGLLGERDEVSGGDQAALGVVPAQQRLHPGDVAVGQPHDRLVVQLELATVQAALEIGAQLQAGEDTGVHLGLEQPVAALAVTLGDVHRGVRVADQLVSADRRGAGHDRDADAAAHHQLLARDHQRLAQVLEHAFGDLRCDVGALQILQQHHKLVAAEARRRVAGADAVGQALGHVDQRRVAGAMTEAVVDRLEVVDVEEHHPEPALLAPRAADRVTHPLHEQRPVGEIGDGIVEGLVGELLLEGLALADVAGVQDDAPHVLVVHQVGVQDLELAQVAVSVAQRALDDLPVAARVGRSVSEQPQQAAGVLLRDEAVEAGADELLRPIAEDALGGGALVGDRGVRPHDGDQVAGVLHERGKARLAALRVYLLGEAGALERERELGCERLQSAARLS